MLGNGFMGKAHSLALHALLALEERPAALPRLVSICARDGDALDRARDRYGWTDAVSDWHIQVSDARVAVFDNAAPNALHLDPSLEALRNGKHVFCEKPLARNADEALSLWVEAERADVVHWRPRERRAGEPACAPSRSTPRAARWRSTSSGSTSSR
jgi:predicted dehydrogenase